jgi:hypothetical protein
LERASFGAMSGDVLLARGRTESSLRAGNDWRGRGGGGEGRAWDNEDGPQACGGGQRLGKSAGQRGHRPMAGCAEVGVGDLQAVRKGVGGGGARLPQAAAGPAPPEAEGEAVGSALGPECSPQKRSALRRSSACFQSFISRYSA